MRRIDVDEGGKPEGRLYLCAIKDAFGGQIVGYSVDSRMNVTPGP